MDSDSQDVIVYDVSLALDSFRPKDLVDKQNSTNLGKTYFTAYVRGLPSGKTCSLKNISDGTPYGSPLGNYATSQNIDASNLQNNENNFRLECTDMNPVIYTSLVNVKGQSGTLTGGGCFILSGNSSCDATYSWNTVNPHESTTTSVIKVATNEVINSGNSGNGTITIPYGSMDLKITNKVDGEMYAAPPFTNILETKTFTATCITGTVWTGTKCLSSLPDLRVFQNLTQTTGFVGNYIPLKSMIKNEVTCCHRTQRKYFSQLLSSINFKLISRHYGNYRFTDYRTRNFMNKLDSNTQALTQTNHVFYIPGTYHVRACADKKNRSTTPATDEVDESNEENNCGEGTQITIAPLPLVRLRLCLSRYPRSAQALP